MPKWNEVSTETINTLLTMGVEDSTCSKRNIASVLLFRYDRIAIIGHNGPPIGFEDYCSEKCPRENSESGMDMDKCPAIHAEVYPIIRAAKLGSKPPTDGATLFINCGLPCKDCMKEIINAGIVRIVSPFPIEEYERSDGFASGCTYNFPLSAKMMRQSGIEYVHNPNLIRHKGGNKVD